MSFEKLEKEFGTRCVWRDKDNNHILFSLTEALMDDEEGQEKINEKYEEDVDFKWCIAMGDDTSRASHYYLPERRSSEREWSLDVDREYRPLQLLKWDDCGIKVR